MKYAVMRNKAAKPLKFTKVRVGTDLNDMYHTGDINVAIERCGYLNEINSKYNTTPAYIFTVFGVPI
jgi:hypothetical protein